MLNDYSPTITDEIINAIQTYNETTTQQKWLVCPVSVICNKSIPKDNCAEVRLASRDLFSQISILGHQLLDALLSALINLKASEFEGTENCVPQPYKSYPVLDSSVALYDLPLVLVPPEVIEMETLSTDSGEEAQIKKEDWPEFFVRVFPNDVSPLLRSTSFFTIFVAGFARLQQSTRLCHPNGFARHHRDLRSQSKGMCASITRVSQMDCTRNFQTKARSTSHDRSCTK